MYYVFLVFIGGGLGSVLRYAFNLYLNRPTMPFGTFSSNVISCLVLGIFIGISSKTILSDPQKLFFMTGFCGGFSTFSTFSGEIVTLVEGSASWHALAYTAMSILGGVLSILLGIALAKLFH